MGRGFEFGAWPNSQTTATPVSLGHLHKQVA